MLDGLSIRIFREARKLSCKLDSLVLCITGEPVRIQWEPGAHKCWSWPESLFHPHDPAYPHVSSPSGPAATKASTSPFWTVTCFWVSHSKSQGKETWLSSSASFHTERTPGRVPTPNAPVLHPSMPVRCWVQVPRPNSGGQCTQFMSQSIANFEERNPPTAAFMRRNLCNWLAQWDTLVPIYC